MSAQNNIFSSTKFISFWKDKSQKEVNDFFGISTNEVCDKSLLEGFSSKSFDGLEQRKVDSLKRKKRRWIKHFKDQIQKDSFAKTTISIWIPDNKEDFMVGSWIDATQCTNIGFYHNIGSSGVKGTAVKGAIFEYKGNYAVVAEEQIRTAKHCMAKQNFDSLSAEEAPGTILTGTFQNKNGKLYNFVKWDRGDTEWIEHSKIKIYGRRRRHADVRDVNCLFKEIRKNDNFDEMDEWSHLTYLNVQDISARVLCANRAKWKNNCSEPGCRRHVHFSRIINEDKKGTAANMAHQRSALSLIVKIVPIVLVSVLTILN